MINSGKILAHSTKRLRINFVGRYIFCGAVAVGHKAGHYNRVENGMGKAYRSCSKYFELNLTA